MEQAYQSNLNQGLDYLFYDRGFYDRLALLSMDFKDGQVSLDFTNRMRNSILDCVNRVDSAFLFLIPPVTSLERLPGQKAKGLDNSNLMGELKDNTEENLTSLYQTYEQIRTNYREIIPVDGLLPERQISLEILSKLNGKLK